MRQKMNKFVTDLFKFFIFNDSKREIMKGEVDKTAIKVLMLLYFLKMIFENTLMTNDLLDGIELYSFPFLTIFETYITKPL